MRTGTKSRPVPCLSELVPEAHCPTCTCHQRVDCCGIPLSRYHTVCPRCRRAISTALLKMCGGLCEHCKKGTKWGAVPDAVIRRGAELGHTLTMEQL